ncbi:MAG: GNAT family N-acetyltransferase [Casimicrobiaceae bacterium]
MAISPFEAAPDSMNPSSSSQAGQVVPVPAVSLRDLLPTDAAAYRAVRLRALADFPEAFTSSAKEEAASADAWSVERVTPRAGRVLMGAFVGDTLGGTAGLIRLPRQKERHKADLFGMYVGPEHGGRHIGRQLVDALIATGRTWPGLEQITLTVTRGNARAQRLYHEAGFVTFGIEHRAIKVGATYYDKEHMVLFLNPS